MSTTNTLTADLAALSTTIGATAERLRALSQRSHQDRWHFCLEPISAAVVLSTDDWRQWPVAVLNERGHIAWPRGQRSLWLCQQMTVPETWNGYALMGHQLRFKVVWWADSAQLYVNGIWVQSGDLFDCFTRLKLSEQVTPGDQFTVAMQLVSPGHDDGALVSSEVIYEAPDLTSPDPGFVADELTVLDIYSRALAPDKLKDIAAAIAPLDWSTVPQPAAFQTELATLRQRLLPLSRWIKQRQIACVGHAHLDLAWLWPVTETWQAAERTFESVLSLQETFPELTYTHSSPALLAWLETHNPTLFAQVVAAVHSGRWAIDAGLWVEPELNIIGGESLVRQLLYGQRYVESRFGHPSAIAWLPDSFGFSWQLPQLLRQGGVQCFATQKLRWNDTTSFPHDLFWWQGLDGTAILSLTLPPIGSDIAPAAMATHAATWEARTALSEALWLPGVGDHGGGPTRDMLEQARRWGESPFFPTVRFTSARDHLTTVMTQATQGNPAPGGNGLPPTQLWTNPAAAPQLPTWDDELYLELHRGCYTTHADQKWFNRYCEQALVEAELLAAIAQLQGGMVYPQATLTTAWQQALFNQFHDILPGTAIPEVFTTANRDWQGVADTAQAVRSEALTAIADSLTLPPPPQHPAIPLVIFNALNWQRTDLVEISLEHLPLTARTWGVFDSVTQTWLPSQVSTIVEPPPAWYSGAPAVVPPQVLVLVTVPAVGYRVVWLVPDPDPALPEVPVASPPSWCLTNDWVRAVIDPTTGDLQELWDVKATVNVVRSPANQLQAFRDAGQYWDAWDIAPDYEAHPLPRPELQSIHWLETGPLRQRLRVIRRLGASTFQQDYILDRHLPYLKVATVADWQASQVVLKAAFPLTATADQATFGIPFGAIARPTNPSDPHEQAKWEVPALGWAHLGNDQGGLSILSGYKHGFDTQPQQLRLTLLKAPIWPDPTADRGRHSFTYALYPHRDDWRSSRTPHHAIAMTTPCRWVTLAPVLAPESAAVPAAGATSPLALSFLDVGADTVHLAAFKPSEADPNRYILRCWDMYGQASTLEVSTAWGQPSYERVNLLETAIASDAPDQLSPWQIATLNMVFPAPCRSHPH